MRTISASDLRQNSMRLQEALRDDLLVTKRDKPFVVVMDYEKYIKLQAYINEKENQLNTSDDDYPSISFDEASKRVKEAVERYHNQDTQYASLDDEYWDSLDALIDNAKGIE